MVRAERVLERADDQHFDLVGALLDGVGHVAFPGLRNEMAAEPALTSTLATLPYHEGRKRGSGPTAGDLEGLRVAHARRVERIALPIPAGFPGDDQRLGRSDYEPAFAALSEKSPST